MNQPKKSKNTLRFLYFSYVLFASLFVVMGVGNFRTIINTQGFTSMVGFAVFFLILDIALFYHYNSRALGFLKELRALNESEKKPE